MVVVLLLFKMSMTVGKRAECSYQGGSPEPGHRYAVVECEIRYTCCRSTAAIVFMLPSLCRWLVVERPPVARVSWLRDRIGVSHAERREGRVASKADVLEEQNVRLRFVNLVVLPAETLQKDGLAPAMRCPCLSAGRVSTVSCGRRVLTRCIPG